MVLRYMDRFHSTVESVNVINIIITVPYRISHLQMLTLSLVVPDLTSPGRRKKERLDPMTPRNIQRFPPK